MNIKTWESEFPSKIKNRGREYYTEGRVKNLRRNGHDYKADVKGANTYQVVIQKTDDEISALSCNCAYAKEHDNCKHMAAVLYAIEDFDENQNEEAGKTDQDETLESVLNSMNEEQLRSELRNVLDESPQLKERLIILYGKSPIDEHDVNRLIAGIDALAYEAGDYNGFINWNSGHKYVQLFLEYLKNMVQPS